jgi:two-component system NarL family sensor kinase
VAEISNLNEPENRTERRQGKLLEVYYPIRGPDGRVLLFETYQRFSAVSSGGAAVLRKFLPIFLLALLVLSLAQAPLAWSMARSLRDSQLDREQLLLTAIEASDRERRRIASEVHDGPVQELAGVSFALAGAADRAQADTPPEVRRSLEDAATATRGVMRQLRGMLVEIHPPNLHTTGLESALSDLLAPLAAKGVETRLDAADVPEMSLDAEALLFRAAQETVRNAVTHANARHVVVAVSRDNGMAKMTISDDGRGFDSEEQDRRQAEGHMGLRILRDLVAHAGGTFELDSTPGQGTTVSIGVPLR